MMDSQSNALSLLRRFKQNAEANLGALHMSQASNPFDLPPRPIDDSKQLSGNKGPKKLKILKANRFASQVMQSGFNNPDTDTVSQKKIKLKTVRLGRSSMVKTQGQPFNLMNMNRKSDLESDVQRFNYDDPNRTAVEKLNPTVFNSAVFGGNAPKNDFWGAGPVDFHHDQDALKIEDFNDDDAVIGENAISARKPQKDPFKQTVEETSDHEPTMR